MTTDPASAVLAFRGDPHEADLSWASGRDVNGPLSCGCFRVAVLDFGHDETCATRQPAADTKPTLWADIYDVLRYVSRGRGYVDCEPYPDAQARRALGALPDEPPAPSGRVVADHPAPILDIGPLLSADLDVIADLPEET